MRDLYIADWHYGHEEILDYDNRPFDSLDAMNHALIDYWNQAVNPDDHVYIVGDMFVCDIAEAKEVLTGLNGTKTLIRGNHDPWTKPYGLGGEIVRRFDRVADYLEVCDNDRWVALCHYPQPCFHNSYYGWYHLYGHVHDSYEAHMIERSRNVMEKLYDRPHRMYNIGAMMPWMDWVPKTLDEIISGYERFKNWNANGGNRHAVP